MKIPDFKTKSENPESADEEKSKNKFASQLINLISSFIAGAIIFGIAGYYLGGEENIKISFLPKKRDKKVEVLGANNIPSTLSEALTVSCKENKISMLEFPYKLADSLKPEYSAGDSIVCAKDVGYAYAEHISDIPNTTGADKSIYFYDENLKTSGDDHTIKIVKNFPIATINGRPYFVEILEPEPYGLSTRGIWVNTILEKKNEETGNIVQIVGLSLLTDDSVLELVKKYGEEIKLTDVETITTVKPSEKDKFKADLLNIIPSNPTIITTSEEIFQNLEGITF